MEKAEKKAREKVRAENPHLTDADLEIKMSDAAKSPKTGNRRAEMYGPQYVIPGRPPIGQVDAQQMHAAMMNNRIAMQQMQREQIQNLNRAAAAADWPRHRGQRPPVLGGNAYPQLQALDPFAAGVYPHGQHRQFDPAARHPQLNFPAPIAMGAVPFPASATQQQQDRVNERGRYIPEPRRRELDRGI